MIHAMEQWMTAFKIGDPIKTLFKPDFGILPADNFGMVTRPPMLELRVYAPDADGTKGIIRVQIQRELSDIDTPDRLFQVMRELLHKMLLHEADESIYVNGTKVFDPHRGER